MPLRIRQIVLAARDLNSTVAQLQAVLGVNVCYHDPEVGKFGLKNALMVIGPQERAQFLEVVSPTQADTAAGRHLERHGDSGYMLILQTDDLQRDRKRFEQLGVRIVWQAQHDDITAVHLHPKDIGAAIVSIDQPVPSESWRWAGPDWKQHVSATGAQRVTATHVAARDPIAMARQWSKVLGTSEPQGAKPLSIEIEEGRLQFDLGRSDVIAGFGLDLPNPGNAFEQARELGLPIEGNAVTICGTRFELTD